MIVKPTSIGFLSLSLLSCSGASLDPQASETEAAVVPVVAAREVVAPALPPLPPEPTGPADFVYNGQLIQGGWLRGQAPAGSVSASLGGQQLTLDEAGYFFAAFDRDAGETARLTAQMRNGSIVQKPLSISPRQWNIERVNLARPQGKASEAFMVRRRPELAQINAARKVDADSNGWRQNFIWPVTGRISGRFGSQRIYAGVPGSYHSGIDIATGSSGTPYVAPADGVVVLATERPFSLEGYLLIIDHGNGLNSAFLHNSKLVVSEGDVVRQGEHIGNIGSTGSATGPHLHWSIKWHGARLDPLLFTGPMP
ncbi:M23 family metallopeptidase [Pontixanthobacter gangjinensis]|uniref:Peptidoglycan DD-metalloendopeptidase family protein n=1 Tax=Pontixanthobacter gangjinensis TaxID=1028742 RepID=A0A6I4SJI1_9SPHN|nr:M23 family metallopeptidase [Pontixanthobacter gangjinensis]MXO55764.1 peptidoglycan DD-metalloendopeptidase family protein [Pontixanthobacter gangjinensis]